MMSRLLLDEQPLVILPKLAVAIGLNEAIVLQQLHYWLEKSNHIHDGHRWIYNTYSDWMEQFPFWSKNTIIRAINSLVNQELVVKGNYNKLKIDNTNWYRINHNALDRVGRPHTQNGQTEKPKRVDEEIKMSKPLPEITSETTTKTTTDIKDNVADASSSLPYKEIVDYLNEKCGTSYKHTSSATKKLINARIKECFTIEDFKRVIDIKAADWLADKKMSVYLRPATLFGTKFESYLNQKGAAPVAKPIADYEGYDFNKERELDF